MKALLEQLQATLQQKFVTYPCLEKLDLLSLARPSHQFTAHRTPYALLEIGESRIGGLPDVPQDFVWPKWKPAVDKSSQYSSPRPTTPAPLGFIAQIDLSAIEHFDNSLPSTGWLYFFYDRYSEPWGFDPNDRGSCRVLYSNVIRTDLARAEAPEDAEYEHFAAPCRLEIWPEMTLPNSLPEINYGTAEYDSYHELCESLNNSSDGIIHRLLGYPQLIQNPMELECQLASNGIDRGHPSYYQNEEMLEHQKRAGDWILLLQIDSDEEPGWMWGDVGRIYFWIKKQDLKELNFDDVWLVLQCS